MFKKHLLTSRSHHVMFQTLALSHGVACWTRITRGKLGTIFFIRIATRSSSVTYISPSEQKIISRKLKVAQTPKFSKFVKRPSSGMVWCLDWIASHAQRGFAGRIEQAGRMKNRWKTDETRKLKWNPFKPLLVERRANLKMAPDEGRGSWTHWAAVSDAILPQ